VAFSLLTDYYHPHYFVKFCPPGSVPIHPKTAIGDRLVPNFFVVTNFPLPAVVDPPAFFLRTQRLELPALIRNVPFSLPLLPCRAVPKPRFQRSGLEVLIFFPFSLAHQDLRPTSSCSVFRVPVAFPPVPPVYSPSYGESPGPSS